MKDYIVYHNPDVMGVEVTNADGRSVVTNKKVGDVRGSRIWLLTGQGSPRSFSLRSYFIVEEIESGIGDGFETRLSGVTGEVFDPMLPLNDEVWFDDFKQSQGNFGFGFQTVSEARFIQGFEALVKWL